MVHNVQKPMKAIGSVLSAFSNTGSILDPRFKNKSGLYATFFFAKVVSKAR